MKRICVFCGSAKGVRPEYEASAVRLGHLMAERGLGLVYGGGSIGLMRVVADAVMAKGGHVIGVIPDSLLRREVGHRGVTELRVVDTMHQRKALMADLSDAFIALPGGYGTLEEFCEVVTWSQLGIQQKPCGLLNVAKFYDGLLEFLDHIVREDFVRPENRGLVLVASDEREMLDKLTAWQPPAHIEKWMDVEKR